MNKRIMLLCFVFLLALSGGVSAKVSVIYLDKSSDSMFPTINNTNKIYINETKNVRLNDIVLFDNPFVFAVTNGRHTTYYRVLHRIVGITKEGFITKGDNNKVQDNWLVKKNNVIGKVIKVG